MTRLNKRITVKSAPAGSSKKKTEKQVCSELVKTLEKVLAQSAQRKFTKRTLRDAAAITVKAAAERSSLHGARKKMASGTSRRQAAKPLESLDLKATLENVNKQLQKLARKKFGGQSIPVSMDLHDVPYHGKYFEDANEVRGGKQKDGTRRFHGFATAYANVNGKRFTLAIIFVPNHTRMDCVVRELMRLVAKAGVGVELLLLDKGYYSVNVIRLLKRLNVSFIMPMKGKRLKKKKGSYKTTYVVRSNLGGVCREELVQAYSVIKYDAGKRFKKHGARQLCYISWRVNLAPKKVAEVYRKRFGIESSYKLSKAVRPRTSSRRPAYRAFLFAASIFLQNAWVEVKQLFCRRVPKWSRQFITLRDFANVMLVVIREWYGEVESFVLPS